MAWLDRFMSNLNVVLDPAVNAQFSQACAAHGLNRSRGARLAISMLLREWGEQVEPWPVDDDLKAFPEKRARVEKAVRGES